MYVNHNVKPSGNNDEDEINLDNYAIVLATTHGYFIQNQNKEKKNMKLTN